MCNETLESSYTLELHIVAVHNIEKLHKCEMCDKRFLFKWKLQRHEKAHQDKTIRKCYFYNNRLECPFFENGCKFAHEIADQCKFAEKCRKTKCQFRHE